MGGGRLEACYNKASPIHANRSNTSRISVGGFMNQCLVFLTFAYESLTIMSTCFKYVYLYLSMRMAKQLLPSVFCLCVISFPRQGWITSGLSKIDCLSRVKTAHSKLCLIFGLANQHLLPDCESSSTLGLKRVYAEGVEMQRGPVARAKKLACLNIPMCLFRATRGGQSAASCRQI